MVKDKTYKDGSNLTSVTDKRLSTIFNGEYPAILLGQLIAGRYVFISSYHTRFVPYLFLLERQ